MDKHPYTFTEVADAIEAARRDHAAGVPVVWSGPDKLHHSVSAGSPEPSWQLSEEGLEHHADQGRSFEDVLTMVIFQLGYSSAATYAGARWNCLCADCFRRL